MAVNLEAGESEPVSRSVCVVEAYANLPATRSASDAAGAAISADLDWLTTVWPTLPADVRESILVMAGSEISK